MKLRDKQCSGLQSPSFFPAGPDGAVGAWVKIQAGELRLPVSWAKILISVPQAAQCRDVALCS